MTATMRDVVMVWPHADRDMHPRLLMRSATKQMAYYAAARGMSLVSAPHLVWQDGLLTGRAHARPAGDYSWPKHPAADGPPMPACARHSDPEMWTSDDPLDQAEAARVCRTKCPLIESCLAGAIARREREHTWGGEHFPLPRRQTARATVA